MLWGNGSGVREWEGKYAGGVGAVSHPLAEHPTSDTPSPERVVIPLWCYADSWTLSQISAGITTVS